MRYLRLLVPLVGGALIVVIGIIGAQLGVSAATPPPSVIGATTTVRVCQAVSSDNGSVVVDSVGSPGGTVQLARADGTELGSVPGGQLRVIGVEQGVSTLARAVGEASARSAQSVVEATETGPRRGLSVVPCTSAGTESWFVGVGASETNRTVLNLTNADLEPSEVSVNIWTTDGPSSAAGSTGISIQPGETQEIALQSLLETDQPVAVQVLSTSGRVAAVASIERGSGAQPAGADWSASAVAPARSVLVPGIPGGDGSRDLVVVNPGTERTQATVEILGADGAFAPADADQLDLGPGQVAEVALATAVDGEPVAVRVSADQPVTAAVAASSSDGDDADVALIPAAPSIGSFGTAAVASWDGAPGTLLVSSPVEASFGWQAQTAEGEVSEGTATVAAGGTTTVELPEGPLASLQVTPEGAVELTAAVVLAGEVGDSEALSVVVVGAGDPLLDERPIFDDRTGS